ncbi:SHOCT domain-containing protein [Virgibacillus kimchii]
MWPLPPSVRIVLTIIVLIVLIIILIRFTRKKSEISPRDSLVIMKERMERGEISEEEYEEARKRRGK